VCDRRDQYRKCANLVEAVHQLMEYFQQYEAIPKVRGAAAGFAGRAAAPPSPTLRGSKWVIAFAQLSSLSPCLRSRLSNPPPCITGDVGSEQLSVIYEVVSARVRLRPLACVRSGALHAPLLGCGAL
jgi:hypothetical protein